MKNVPEKNDIVTLANVNNSDRSYCSSVWRVIAINNTHAKLRWVDGQSTFYENRGPIIIQLKDYEFSSADKFVNETV